MAFDKDWQVQAGTLMQQGVAAANLHQDTAAQRAFEQAIVLYQRAGGYDAEAAAWHYLGRVAEHQRSIQEAEEHYQHSLKLASKESDMVATTYLRLALLAQKTRRLDEAEVWIARSRQLAQRLSLGGKTYAAILSVSAEVLLQRVREGQASVDILQKAYDYAEQALALQQRQQPQSDLWRVLHTLAEIAKLEGKTQEWRTYRQRERENCIAFPETHTVVEDRMLMLLFYFVAKGDPQAQGLLKVAAPSRERDDPIETLMSPSVLIRCMGQIAQGDHDWQHLAEAEDLSGPETLVVLEISEMVSGRKPPPSLFPFGERMSGGELGQHDRRPGSLDSEDQMLEQQQTKEEYTVANVQPFTRSMIANYLKGADLSYLTDNDGDFVVQFGYEDIRGCRLSFYLMAAGKNADVYSIMVRSDKRIPKSDWERAMIACNTWNKDRRWPKAYLEVDDPTTDTTGEIILEGQIDLGKGIHQELLDSFTETLLLSGNMFWVWAHKEQGF